MKKQELSIIIPVYNGQNYITDCVNSILRQKDSSQYEIIIVNDGSTDNTKNILFDIANKNKNIRLINQKNLGVSVARNNGINASHGKYITFVDADDMVGLKNDAFYKYIQTDFCIFTSNLRTIQTYKFPNQFDNEHFTNDYFTNMLRTAYDTGADVVLGGKITINLKQSCLIQQVYTSNHVYGENVDEKISISNLANIRESANFALYRRQTLNTYKLRFMPEMDLDEDILFCMLAVLCAKKVATVKDVTYFYNRHENTLSNITDYRTNVEKSVIALTQLFSYLLITLKKTQKSPELFNYWMREYSKNGKNFCYPYGFPPDTCYYRCKKDKCTDCRIAQKMCKIFEENVKKYRTNTK